MLQADCTGQNCSLNVRKGFWHVELEEEPLPHPIWQIPLEENAVWNLLSTRGLPAPNAPRASVCVCVCVCVCGGGGGGGGGGVGDTDEDAVRGTAMSCFSLVADLWLSRIHQLRMESSFPKSITALTKMMMMSW